MKASFTIVGLLLVALVLLWLGKSSMRAVQPLTGAASEPVAGAGGTGSAGSTAPVAKLPQQVQQDVSRALQQGARRASEPE